MRFIRLAVIQFSGLNAPLPGGPSRKMMFGPSIEVQLELIPDTPEKGPHPYFVICTSNYISGAAIVDFKLQLNEQIRQACELAIECVANALAVSHSTPREIYSYFAPYAIYPESEEERQQLAGLADFPKSMQADLIYTYKGTQPDDYLQHMADRFEGTALMAECLSNTTSLGRYRECIRLFELAFKRGAPLLEKPLFSFLAGSSLGYTRPEIREWIRYRDAASHADKKVAKKLAFERDVRPLMGRMHQAALDVLFNKLHWHNPGTERRSVWYPATALMPEKAIRGTVGHPISLPVKPFDCFSVWPLWMKMNFARPPGWWWCLESAAESIHSQNIKWDVSDAPVPSAL